MVLIPCKKADAWEKHNLLECSLNRRTEAKGPNNQNSVPVLRHQADISYLDELWEGRKVRIGIPILTRFLLYMQKPKTW